MKLLRAQAHFDLIDQPPMNGGGSFRAASSNAALPNSVCCGFACCLLLLTVVIAAGFWGNFQSNALFRAIEHSQAIQLRALSVLTKIQVCSLAMRAFVSTGQDRFLGSLQADKTAAVEAFRQLKAQVVGDTLQAERAKELGTLLHRYLGFNSKVLAVQQESGSGTAAELIAEGTGQRQLDVVQAIVSDICEHEQRRLDGNMLAGRQHHIWEGVVFLGTASLGVCASVLISVLRADSKHRGAAQSALRAIQERFQRAVRGSTDGLWDWEIASGVVWYAPRFKELLGYRENEFPNLLRSWQEHLHPDDRASILRALDEHVVNETPYDVEYRLRDKAGAYHWFRARGHADRDECGRATRMGGSIQDITALKQAQGELERANIELTRSNQDLEEFAYVASHDLRAPLRAIRNLVEWIEEDLGDSLGGENRERMELVLNRVRRLDGLIEDLLNYSRAGRVLGKVRAVDTAAILEETSQLLGPPIGFEIVATSKLPTFETFAAPFQRVLQNLIQNAIKHHDRPSGRVEVSATDLGRFFEFRVSDDGPGIAPEFHQRVFGLFETLRPRDAVEGSGMGLAVVKRTVERLGGCIRLESDGQRGSVFRFTWPTQIEVNDEARSATGASAPEMSDADKENVLAIA